MGIKIDKKACEEFLADFGNKRWSFSNLSSFNQCRYTWYEQKVLGVKSEGNFHAYVGTSFHKVMEDYYKFILAGGKIDLVSHKLTLTQKLASKLSKNPYGSQVSEIIRNGSYRNTLESIWYHVPFRGVTAVERYIEFEVAGVKFCGYIDIDMKDGHADWKSKWDGWKYMHQQVLYAYGKYLIDGTPPQKFYIPQYKKNMDVEEVPIKKSDVDKAVKWVGQTVEHIKYALENYDFPKSPNDSFYCSSLCSSNTCEFRNSK